MFKILQYEIETPKPFGIFHLFSLLITFVIILHLYNKRDKYNEKQLKRVLAIFGIVVFILELLKQISWAYDIEKNIWSYSWYSAPFQLCSMPMYVSLICLFLKKGKVRDALLSFICFYTILGSIAAMILPNNCFVSDLLVNIHTMYLHCGAFVLSIYLLMNEIKPTFKNFKGAFIVFIICVSIALALNISFYKTGIIGDHTFNMFYISPYFTSELPVFSTLQESVPYPVFLLIYIFGLTLGASIIFGIAKLINKLCNK